MRNWMLALILTTCVVTLVLPATSEAGVARVRALAGGDARLLPDDDGSIAFFPNRLNQHHRIAIQNVAPDGHPDYDSSSNPFMDFQNAEAWLEASWEAMGGTAQVGLNRPTSASAIQASVNQIAGDQTRAARSLIDLGYANDSWGALVNFGLNNVEDQDSNWFFEGTFGTVLGGGQELAVFGGFNKVPMLDVFEIGVNGHMESDGRFFNHAVSSVAYQNLSPEVGDSLNNLLIDYTRFHNEQGRFAEGLTTLVGLGASFDYISGGGSSASALAVPNVTAGAEYAAVSWLNLMGSVTRSFLFTFGDVPSVALTGPVSATMGAGAHWGSFRLEATVMNEFFENGPDFIGGNGNGISSFVSAYYELD